MLQRNIIKKLNKNIIYRSLATNETIKWATYLNKSLKETDPDLYNYIENEKVRQRDSLVLIASENFTSKSVFDALGSVMSNKS